MLQGIAQLNWKTMGKPSHFESKMPYLHLNALLAVLQEVAGALHPLTLIRVETRHWEHCKAVEQG